MAWSALCTAHDTLTVAPPAIKLQGAPAVKQHPLAVAVTARVVTFLTTADNRCGLVTSQSLAEYDSTRTC